MNGALANDREMSMASGALQMRREEAEADFSRASSSFALAHSFALLAAITAAVLLLHPSSIERSGTLAAICLGLSAGLVVMARRGLRRVLTNEARRKGLSPSETQEFVRRQLARYGRRRRPRQ
ncbi:hypothetical protein [Paraliomyxa miuraensis]|uniref:hypothetical protein n=1 Tax=Paraliomyxa miuraensis TaxID=376150 RepID=UPI00225C2241|nr:hypothetical protein [Paraliomyxa miuraensis]MCX4240652.1 hypothetical protein [Paraliomyxa miuraensis]